jgi:hypothetical protein
MEMSHTHMTAFEAGKDEVERRMSAGEPFGRIEDMIDRAKISEDQKAALWLLAWSGQAGRVRRRIVVEALASGATSDDHAPAV